MGGRDGSDSTHPRGVGDGMRDAHGYELRWAREGEWSAAIRMVWRTFLKFEGKDYTKEGIQNFYEFLTDDRLYMSFLRGEYPMMVALDNGRIIGVGTIRDRNRLSLLFVEEAYHHMGVGSAIFYGLCTYLKNEVGEGYMRLMAAPYAVDFYRKLGFSQDGPEREFGGIRVTVMEKEF